MIALDKRKICISLRKQLTKTERESKEKAIFEQVLPFLKGNVGAYHPIQGEVDIYSSLKGYNDLYVPKVIDDTTILFYSDHEPKIEGSFHVIEPEGKEPFDDLDVIIIPVVGFKDLYRMGHGKGYYDRFLANTDALKIGVAFDCQECEFEIKENDVPMDIMITETRRFGI